MQLKDLYQKSIERNLNPVVNAENLDAETVKTEIEEYVFTEEIIDGLYKILDAIRSKKYNHDGIWINGYFGSGKSHFLKYLNYCFDPKYRDAALERLKEGVNEFDPLTNPKSKLYVTPAEVKDLCEWLKKATVDTILFNIGQVSNYQGDADKVFLNVFWNEFNHFRGYNKFNLALAQHFEKALDARGKLGEFKEKISEEGFDWDTEASDLAINELDLVMEKGKEVLPTLSTDIIRKKVEDDSIFLSVETFTNELAAYLDTKDKDYRLVFLVDEVSQFINDRKNLLLQLQSIVERLHTACKDQVWVACTAQQELNEIVESCKMNDVTEAIGKIMGRFEVRMSLKGTKPEYITQKRVLEKNGTGEKELGKMYDDKKNALEAQFQLPATYNAYGNRDEFIGYYPFVPYQLRLIQQVFNSFVDHGFVDTEVKGNERSIIKVTYNTAQLTKDEDVGHFIGFDQFFHAMFQNSLTNKGQKALTNASKFAEEYQGDTDFAMRVVNVLFMVANMGESDKLLFKATVDNLSILLMRDVDAQKLALKEQVQKVLQFLCDKNAIRKETDKSGDEIYLFYNEEEMEVANLIKNKRVDDSYMAEKLKAIIFEYFGMTAKENYFSRSFSVCAEIFSRTFLSTNNPEMKVEFVFDRDGAENAETYALKNSEKSRMAFYLADFYNGDSKFKANFFRYCQTFKYLETEQATSDLRARTNATFRERANTLLNTKLLKQLHDALDSCQIVSGDALVSASMVGQKGGKDRYKNAVKYHLGQIYPQAPLVDKYPMDQASLAKKILSPLPDDPMGLGYPLCEAERKMETYLQNKGKACSVKEVVHYFGRPPYGWAETCTLQALNELVRSRHFEFSFNNIPRPEPKVVADNLLKYQEKFEIDVAEAIPQKLVNDFIDAWKDCFSVVSVGNSSDANSVFDYCRNTEKNDDALGNKIEDYQKLRYDFGHRPFTGCLDKALEQLLAWEKIHDPKTFFETVIASRDAMVELLGKCRDLAEFRDGNFEKYKDVLDFISNNEENFTYLGEDEKGAVAELEAIKNDEWPIGNMKAYIKFKRELSGKIEEQKEALRKELRDANSVAYDELVDMVGKIGLKNAPESYLPTKDSYVKYGCDKQSLAGLKGALHEVDEQKSKWVGVLMQKLSEENAVSPSPSVGGNNATSEPEPSPAPRKQKPVMVNIKKDMAVHSGTQLKSEADVDEYLAKLKVQLMQHVNDDEFTIIQ